MFEPLNDAKLDYIIDSNNDVSKTDVIKTTNLKIMENQINQVEMRIPLPELNEVSTSNTAPTTWSNTFNITNIEILAKESDSPAVKVVADIKVNTTSSSTFMDSIEAYHQKPINSFTKVKDGNHSGTAPVFTTASFDDTNLEAVSYTHLRAHET